MCQSLSLLIEKREKEVLAQCFTVNITKFLRTSFLQNRRTLSHLNSISRAVQGNIRLGMLLIAEY